MAKKAKKPIRKPKKKAGLRKKKSNNLITKLIVVFFVLLLAFFMIFIIFKPSEKKRDVKTPMTQLVDTKGKDEAKPDEKPKVAETNTPEDKPSPREERKIEKLETETKAVEMSISGTWMSTTGGAVLTMKNKEYRLDFMGVDSDKPIIGTYSVEGDIITFTNKKDPCMDVKGLYVVKFNKNEIRFKCKSDDCTKRKATLPTEWAWLDTEE